MTEPTRNPVAQMPDRPVTLADFLLARISDDEIYAGIMRAGRREMRWQWSTHGYSGPPTVEIAGTGEQHPPLIATVQSTERVHEHIARWDPARVLAECEAKRRIIAESSVGPDGQWEAGWDACGELVLQRLAMPYYDHPDFREEWRP